MSESVDNLASNQTIIAALIAMVGTVIVGFVSFFGGRGSVQAQLQGQLNASFKALTDELQEERQRDRSEVGDCKRECIELRGQIRGLEQHLASLEALLQRNGIDVPQRPNITTLVILESAG